MEKLHDLIDRNTTLNIFDKIAHLLINQSVLIVGNTEYEFMELEFYLYEEGSHEDYNIHKACEQKVSNSWYLHKRGSSFSNGNHKGLDITFGNDNNFGGILIRGLKKTDSYISGPSSCVGEIMRTLDIANIKDLGENLKNKSIDDGKLKIKKISDQLYDPNKNPMMRSNRYRLSDNSCAYFDYPYRYIKNDKGYRKENNCQEKENIFYYSLALGIDEEIVKNFADRKNFDFENLENKNRELYNRIHSLKLL